VREKDWAPMTREPGEIVFVGKDVKEQWHLTFKGCYGAQGFHGPILPDGSSRDRAFRDEIAALFDVRFPHDARGQACFALRAFPFDDEPIEGFEVDGRRWTMTGFLRRLQTEGIEIIGRLGYRRQGLEEAIEAGERKVVRDRERLAKLETLYIDWEVPR
jgi:hypothetical protein